MEKPILGDTISIGSAGKALGDFPLKLVTVKAYGIEVKGKIKWLPKSKIKFIHHVKAKDGNYCFLCRVPAWLAKGF